MSDHITRKEFVEIIGDFATDELLRAWGGIHFHFPKTLPKDHPLEFVVGRHNADLLCKHFGGCVTELPVFDDRNTARRNELIIEQLKGGATQAKVAAYFGVKPRTVRAIYDKYKRSEK